jgi:hypothetical protein
MGYLGTPSLVMDSRFDTPLIFGDPARATALSKAVRRGRARRLAVGLYTFDLKSDPARLIRDHWVEVTAFFCPGAVIADRSAIRAAPDAQGHLFVVHPRERPLVLPGLTIVPRRGAGPIGDDIALPHGLWLSSRPRALVENLRPSRAVKGRPSRTLTTTELHAWVAQLLRSEGRSRLNALRDRARALASDLRLEALFPELDDLIGAALGSRSIHTDVPALAAAQVGRPYDERRDAAFEALFAALDARAPAPRPLLATDARRMNTLPFFEAYFSNFIEGTEFTVEEAADIVFSGTIPRERPEDAHDILGTYRVVADPDEMARPILDADMLLELLQSRHAQVLEGRPEKNPGRFKTRANRAGSSQFVAPELVIGTLVRGFDALRKLSDPFARAVFLMFLVSEVHPFDDGNGRVARIMMNGELHQAGEHRIIIPTVYRNEYLSSLRALTHNMHPMPLIRVLDFAQRYVTQLDLSTLASGSRVLEATHAFVDPTDALDKGIRLTLPSAIAR